MFKGLRKRLMKTEKGQALVEFALLLPIALLILCAVVDYGWLFTHELVLTNSVRDGARVGITCVDQGDFVSKVQERVKQEASICDESRLNVTPTKDTGNVVVTATYHLKMLTPMAKLIVGGMTYDVQVSCTMRPE